MLIIGKRGAIFCSLLSAWAIVMLAIMGMFLYARALAFVEDLELEHSMEEFETAEEFTAFAYSKYVNAAHNCWIAACLYIATLAFSLHQYYTNRKVQYGF